MTKRTISGLLTACLLVSLSLISAGCGQKQAPLKVYMYDLPKNTVTEIMEANIASYFSPWSDDSRHFFIIDRDKGIRLFEADTLQEIKLPEKNIQGGLFADWVDGRNLLLEDRKIDLSDYFLYNLDKKAFIDIAGAGGRYELHSIISNKQEIYRERYAIGDLITLLHNNGIFPIESMYSLKKDKALYSVNDYETYLYDIKSGEKKLLFKGFNFEWSPGESKIKYNVPKDPENFIFEKNAPGGKFETCVYDLNTGRTQKIADFYASTYFSYDDQRIVFYEMGYQGVYNLE